MSSAAARHELPAGQPDDGAALNSLLEAARSEIDEELRRSERLDAKGRNHVVAVGALFAVVMVGSASTLNALTDRGPVPPWVFPMLGVCALFSIVGLGAALYLTFETWTLRKTEALDPDTLEEYVRHAEQGKAAVTARLIEAYAEVLRRRRKANEDRVRDLKRAVFACIAAAAFALTQLAAVFGAIIFS